MPRLVFPMVDPDLQSDGYGVDIEGALTVHTAVLRLPPTRRTIVALMYCGDWSRNDAARHLGLTAAAVRHELSLAKKALQHELGGVFVVDAYLEHRQWAPPRSRWCCVCSLATMDPGTCDAGIRAAGIVANSDGSVGSPVGSAMSHKRATVACGLAGVNPQPRRQ